MKNCPKCNSTLKINGGWACPMCGLTSESTGYYDANFDAWMPMASIVRQPGPRADQGTRWEQREVRV
ncbi:MAG: hypothetical protein WC294_08160 [Methanoregula sp.]|jgi:ribosomal protein L37AE/L43A